MLALARVRGMNSGTSPTVGAARAAGDARLAEVDAGLVELASSWRGARRRRRAGSARRCGAGSRRAGGGWLLISSPSCEHLGGQLAGAAELLAGGLLGLLAGLGREDLGDALDLLGLARGPRATMRVDSARASSRRRVASVVGGLGDATRPRRAPRRAARRPPPRRRRRGCRRRGRPRRCGRRRGARPRRASRWRRPPRRA